MSKDRKEPSINHHLRREGKLMLWLLLGVPVALVALAAWLGPYLLNHLNASSHSETVTTEKLSARSGHDLPLDTPDVSPSSKSHRDRPGHPP